MNRIDTRHLLAAGLAIGVIAVAAFVLLATLRPLISRRHGAVRRWRRP